MISPSLFPLLNICTFQFIVKYSDTDHLNSFTFPNTLPMIMEKFTPHKRSKYDFDHTSKVFISIENVLALRKTAFMPIHQKCLNGQLATFILFINSNSKFPEGSRESKDAVYKSEIFFISRVLHAISTLLENPTYIFIKISSPNSIFKRFNIDFLKLSMQSLFFAVTEEYLFLIHPLRTFYSLHLKIVAFNFLQIKRNYRSLDDLLQQNIAFQNNFDRGLIVFNFDTEYRDRPELPDCSLNQNGLYVFPAQCVAVIFRKLFNTTFFYSSRPNYQVTSHFVFGTINKDLIDYFIATPLNFPYRLIPHEFTIVPYVLTVFTEHTPPTFLALLSPFDFQTWIALGTVAFLVFIVFLAILKFKKVTKLCWWLLSSLIQQLDDDETICLFGQLRWKYFPLITSFYCMNFMLAFIYTGEMFSCLTAINIPEVPLKLPKIVYSDIPLISSANFIDPQDYYKFYSDLQDDVLPEMIKQNVHNPPFHTYLKRLLNKITFVFGKEFEVARNISYGLPTSFNMTPLPETFAVLNIYQDIKQMKIAMRWYSSKTIIFDSDSGSSLSTTFAWVVRRNPFYPKFHKTIGLLFQSGLTSRWNEIRNKYAMQGQMVHVLSSDYLYQSFSRGRVTELFGRNVNSSIVQRGKIYAYLMLSETQQSSFTQIGYSSVSLSALQFPFGMMLIFVIICSVVLLSEYFHSKLQDQLKTTVFSYVQV